MKWMDKKPLSFIFVFHRETIVAVAKSGKEMHMPRGIKKYNAYMCISRNRNCSYVKLRGKKAQNFIQNYSRGC
jgi:hypothetical protein